MFAKKIFSALTARDIVLKWCFVSAFSAFAARQSAALARRRQAFRHDVAPVTWASARHARSSPGCNIAGFQPATVIAVRQPCR